jgi:hypothetical protein
MSSLWLITELFNSADQHTASDKAIISYVGEDLGGDRCDICLNTGREIAKSSGHLQPGRDSERDPTECYNFTDQLEFQRNS